MLQQILIATIFLGALGFLGSLLFRNFRAKEGCATGCGKCSPADSARLEVLDNEKIA